MMAPIVRCSIEFLARCLNNYKDTPHANIEGGMWNLLHGFRASIPIIERIDDILQIYRQRILEMKTLSRNRMCEIKLI